MIDEVFGEGGMLAQKFPGYRPRPGQVAMARAVEAALERKRHLVVEAGTGVGKSIGYLVPAIDRALRAAARDPQSPDARVIVVTGNIALAEQLIYKDLPALRGVLPTPFTFAMLKGRNNFLCADALSRELGASATSKDRQLARILEWAQETETGDVSELDETPPPALWRKLSVSSDECKGSGCKFHKQCFAEVAKAKALRSTVIVTNYHLFAAHLVVRRKMREIQERGGSVELDVVLPPASSVIFDEAHKAPDIFRDFLGFQMSKGQVDWLVRGFNHDLATEAKTAADAYFKSVSAHKASRNYRARLKKGHPIEGEPLARVLDRVAKYYKDATGAGAWTPDERAELEMRARKGATLAAQLRMVDRPEQHPDEVFFIEETEKSCFVKSKPIHVAEFLEKELFGGYGSVVMTSATLSTGSQGGFSFFRREIGMKGGDELVAESPFRFDEQVLLVVPSTMCMPDDRERYPAMVAEHVRETCEAADGRTLGLFTSFKNLDRAKYALGDFRHAVLSQGERPRTKLAQMFRDDVHSVLLGSESFWAGVDVPGESLSAVVIDRLPFPTPDDPIVDAIAERDDRWFFNYAVPRAIIQFKQGFGRLIRSETDRGAVVVLDRRIREKGYGREFIRCLPPVKMSDDVKDIRRFLEAR